MDFSIFDQKHHIPILNWLGKRDWTVYTDYPERRAVSLAPKRFYFNSNRVDRNAVVVSNAEIQKYPEQHWNILKELIGVCDHDILSTFWYSTLSKALAGGPKLFQPTLGQCLALENTAASFTFNMYRQPYPVIIIQIPDEYRAHLKEKYKVNTAPSHVIVDWEEKNQFISVSAFTSTAEIIIQITPNRPEYKTIEDSITKNRARRDEDFSDLIESELNAAEDVQRLAMNFAMMMTLLGVRTQPENPNEIKRLKRESLGRRRGNIPTHRAAEAQEKLAAAFMVVQFDQMIDFYEEVVENVEVRSQSELEHLRKSPKVHWRRGHWALQAYGVMAAQRKYVFRKPSLVRKNFFIGELKDTSVTYVGHPK